MERNGKEWNIMSNVFPVYLKGQSGSRRSKYSTLIFQIHGPAFESAKLCKTHRDHFSILFISHWSFLSKAPKSHAEIGQKKTNRGRDGGYTIPKRKFVIKMICISFIRHSGQIVLDLIPFMCPKRKLACRRMVFVHPFMSPCC